MADVHVMPGVFRADLSGGPLDEDLTPMWEAAKNANLRDAVIVGRDGKGEIQVYGSMPDCDKAMGLLMHGVNFFMGATQTMPPDSEDGA